MTRNKKRNDISCDLEYISHDHIGDYQKVNKEMKQCKSFIAQQTKKRNNQFNDKLFSTNKSFDEINKQIRKTKEAYTSLSQSKKRVMNRKADCFSNSLNSTSPNFVSLKQQLTTTINKAKYSNRNNNNNTIYDDVNGYYKIRRGEKLIYRYEIIKILGRGTFGQAVKCYDHKNNEYVCIKIIKSKKKYYDQALSEIEILNDLKNHQLFNEGNIVLLKDTFYFRNHIV